MKKFTSLLLLLTVTIAGFSQTSENSTGFELGKGLNVRMNDGQHQFNIGGFIQLDATRSAFQNNPAQTGFGIERGYLSLRGDHFNNKMSFMLQMNFTESYPLLDAWAAYRPLPNLTISAGQKQSFSGPRSMMYHDQAIAFGQRSIAARTFFDSGRELGLFVESRNSLGSVGMDLGVALTSGDGRNSFGSSSTDFDLGGAKYTARATVYPFGFFTGDNHLQGADFARESTPKLGIGMAYSYNDGASNRIGEGHNDFVLYDSTGAVNYPGYQKISVDLLFKYKGFSLLAEYTNAVGRDLQNIYKSTSVNSKLQPQEIANYLVLGNGINVETGYLFPGNWAIDLRYSTIWPEWQDNSSLIERNNEYTAGIAKYIIDNRLKIQLAGTYIDMPYNSLHNNYHHVQLITHIVF